MVYICGTSFVLAQSIFFDYNDFEIIKEREIIYANKKQVFPWF